MQVRFYFQMVVCGKLTERAADYLLQNGNVACLPTFRTTMNQEWLMNHEYSSELVQGTNTNTNNNNRMNKRSITQLHISVAECTY